VSGADCFIEGLRLISLPGLRRYVIIPLAINVLVLAGVIAYGVSQYDAWTTLVTGWLPEWLQFLSGIFAFVAAMLVFVVMLYLFTIVANMISAPFNAILSVKVEEHLTGRIPGTNPPISVVVFRSLAREFGKLFYYLPRLLGLVLLTFIPFLNAAAPVLWILFGAWMMTIQYVDYAADNNEVSFSSLRARLGEARFQATLFGVLVYLGLAIPVFNLILIPASVAGGTVFWVKYLSPARVS
jgi:CysZ protein